MLIVDTFSVILVMFRLQLWGWKSEHCVFHSRHLTCWSQVLPDCGQEHKAAGCNQDCCALCWGLLCQLAAEAVCPKPLLAAFF